MIFGIGKISDIIFKTEKNVVAYKVETKKTSINTQISKMQRDVKDYEAAMQDFKQEEAKTP